MTRRDASSSSECDLSSGDSGSDSGTYEVERIIDHRVDARGRRQFLLRWKGYGHENDTWEFEDELDCDDLVRDYMAVVKRARRNMVGRGRLIETPAEILGVTWGPDGAVYSVRYGGGRTDTLPSAELFKLSPAALVRFLEDAVGASAGAGRG